MFRLLSCLIAVILTVTLTVNAGAGDCTYGPGYANYGPDCMHYGPGYMDYGPAYMHYGPGFHDYGPGASAFPENNCPRSRIGN